jgi:hypothetical protein
MQRDMDLVRAILLAVEAHPDGYAPHPLAIDGFTPAQIGYHAVILKEAGLVEAIDSTSGDDAGPMAIITRLTWQGHEFIAAARSPSIWSQAKALMFKAGGGSFAVWQSVLTELIKRNVGLS